MKKGVRNDEEPFGGGAGRAVVCIGARSLIVAYFLRALFVRQN